MRIYRYPIAIIDGIQTVTLCSGARILHFGSQFKNQQEGETLAIWAPFIENVPTEERRLLIVGTGHEIPDDEVFNYNYVGTTMQDDGKLVWHLFEVIGG